MPLEVALKLAAWNKTAIDRLTRVRQKQLPIRKSELEVVVCGESIHAPLLQSLWGMDFFGGEEDRVPWSEVAP